MYVCFRGVDVNIDEKEYKYWSKNYNKFTWRNESIDFLSKTGEETWNAFEKVGLCIPITRNLVSLQKQSVENIWKTLFLFRYLKNKE